MPDRKLFELHAELGKCDNGDHYLKLQFSDGSEFVNICTYPADTITSMPIKLDHKGMWASLFDGSIKSVIIGNNVNAQLPPNIKMPKDGSRLRPADLTQVNPPACNPICQSFDIFGVVKCRSICAAKNHIV